MRGLWLLGALALAGCEQNSADQNAPLIILLDAALDGGDAAPVDAGVDSLVLGPTRPCPARWTGIPGDCTPPPLADCPTNTLPLPDGTCSAAWICPPSWSPIESGYGCRPDPLREDCPAGSFATPDGACSSVWTCPPGWRRVTPESGCTVDRCPEGAVPLEGGGCVAPAQADCAAPTWPQGAALIDPDAPEGALADALAAGQPVGLLPGDHAIGDLVIARDALLVGACPAQTRLLGTIRVEDGAVRLARLTVVAAADAPALIVDGGRVELDTMHVVGAVDGTAGELTAVDVVARGGAWDFPGTQLSGRRCHFTDAPLILRAPASLNEVALTGVAEFGVRALSAFTLQDAQIAVDDTGVRLDNGPFPQRIERIHAVGGRYGIEVQGAPSSPLGSTTIHDLDLRGMDQHQGAALVVRDAHAVELARITVQHLGAGELPVGLVLLESAVEARHVDISDIDGTGIAVIGTGQAADVRLADVVIRDVRPAPSDSGRCIKAWGNEMTLRVDGAWLTGCTAAGVYVERGRLELKRTRVHDVRAFERAGYGILILHAAAATLADVRVADARLAGIRLDDVLQARLSRVSVRDVALGGPAEEWGYGLELTAGTRARTDDLWITRTRSAGITLLEGAWSGARVVVDTVDAIGQRGGRGVYQDGGTTARLDQVAILNTQISAWQVGASDEGALSDTRLTGVHAYAAREREGRKNCAVALYGGSVEVKDSVIADTPHCGLQADGATVAMSRVTIEGTRLRSSGNFALLNNGGQLEGTDLRLSGASFGLVTLVGGQTTVERFSINDVHIDAVRAGEGADVGLIDGQVRGSPQCLHINSEAAVTGRGLTLANCGHGVYAEDARVELADVGFSGMSASGVAAQSTDAVTLDRIAMKRFALEPMAGAGMGVYLAWATATIRASTISGATGWGILAERVDLSVDGLQVSGSRPDDEDRADGVHVAWGDFDARDLRLIDNPRAGLVLRDADGHVNGGVIRGHRFGVVLEDGATLAQDAVTYDANERDRRDCPDQCLP